MCISQNIELIIFKSDFSEYVSFLIEATPPTHENISKSKSFVILAKL